MEKSSWVQSDGPKENANSSSNIRENVSFKFSKLTPKARSGNKLQDSVISHVHEEILSIDDNEIKSSIAKKEKKALVIQPIHKNVWRKSSNTDASKTISEGKMKKSLNELAIEELLQESSAKNAWWENRGQPGVPMVIQNKLPEGFETDERLDVALRAEDATPKDYEDVPVTEFGVAVLRGLGCNPGDPVGNKNKKYVEPIEAVQRSKGLGLGAEKKMTKVKTETNEELKLVKGAYICVGQGSHKSSYGTVEGLDESRVIVKLVHLDQNISLPALYVDVVSKKEFQKESKVINKEAYNKYKDDPIINGKDVEHKSRNDRSIERGTSPEFREHRSRTSDHSERQTSPEFREHRSRTSDHSERRHRSKEDQKAKHKRRRSRSRETYEKYTPNENYETWVRPMLKVRFIDKRYKKGRYFNQKMTVEDVISMENCICKTEDGKYLEDLQPSMLETVIPRSDPSHVMIVKGKHKTQLGIILSRNKKECTATVQLLSDRSKVIVMDYDSICEYIGDISMYD